MHKLIIQFYATPSELVGFLSELLKQGLVVVLMKRSPFNISMAASEADLDASLLQKITQIGILNEHPETRYQSWDQFMDIHRDGLFLRVGGLEEQVLAQSWLSAQSASEQVIKRWQKVANLLKQRTSVGVWVVNTSNNATGFYKQFRFTEGAMKLFDEGCRLAPPAGNNLIFLRDPASRLEGK